MIIEKSKDNLFELNFLDRFMYYHKGFIAGGCFKNLFNHEKIKDIDMFFRSTTDFAEADRHFRTYKGIKNKENLYLLIYENNNVKAYKNKENGVVVELNRKVFGEPKEIIQKFDFTITKFAYYKEFESDDDGELVVNEFVICDENFFEHLHLKKLVVDDKLLYPASTFERMIRYIKYGYMPCRETKIKIMKAINELNKEEIEVTNNLYDGFD